MISARTTIRSFCSTLTLLAFGLFSSHSALSNEADYSARSPELLLDELDWRFVGPWRGGRVNAVTGHPTARFTFLAGYTGGGIWKTEDGGVSWRNVSDGHLKLGSIGALDISDSHPDVVYAGTGEQALRGDVSHGDGVYRSGDGGETWTNVGLAESRQIAKIVIHPTDPDTVYVAALGHFAGPNPERGVFRTKDGGKSWERVLFVDEDTGAVGLALDESDPDRLIAGMWDVRRFPWGIRSAGPGSGIYRSTDGGDNWEDISGKDGLPQGIKERMDVSISQSRPNRIWALMSAAGGRGLYRSDDFGDTWRRVNDNAELTGRTYYFQKLLADPADPNRIYILNWDLLVSNDAGESFDIIRTGHADHHAFWIDPADNRRLIDGSDGGAQISYNEGASWSTLHNQPTGQFYTLTVDDRSPYNLYGSQQDWSTLIVPSLARAQDPRGYFDTGYSEAGHVAISQTDPNVLYISDHHWLLRYDGRTDAIKYVGPRDETNYGWGTRDIKYRFNWTFPVVTSIHDDRTVYVGSQYLHRSRDGGETWQVLGPDLTFADPDKLERTPLTGRDVSGNERYWGPLTRDSNGDHWFSTLYTIAESPLTKKVIWTGSDDGVLSVTSDGGRNWANVTPPELPDYAMITRVEASPHDVDTAYFTASAFKLDDYRPFVFRTTDRGTSWRRITAGIDSFDVMRVVREDSNAAGILFAGAESGIYLSLDGGEHWIRPADNFPAVPVYDMKVKGGSLIAATHGRGFWSYDHLAMVHQLAERPDTSSLILFEPDAVLRRDGDLASRGNPPTGVVVRYWLPRDIKALSLEFTDEKGNSIISFQTDPDDTDSPGSKSGLNSFEWDLRYPNATVVPNVVTRGNRNVGPTAIPGRYRARLIAGDVSRQVAFDLLPDPNVTATRRELEEQFEFLTEIRNKLDELNRAVIDIRLLAASVKALRKPSPTAKEILFRLRRVEEKLVQPRARYSKDLHANPVQANDKLYRLANFVSRSHTGPTKVQYELKTEFFALADAALQEFYTLKSNDIRIYNESAGTGQAIRPAIGAANDSDAVERNKSAMPRR